jgi:hypothetical protein
MRASIRAARARAVEGDRIEPRVAAAHYDRQKGRVVLELKNGCAFAFPAAEGKGLENAAPDQLAAVEVEPGGESLHWEALDADISVPGLIARLLKLDEWAPRMLGQRKSEMKAAASRANGRKGGRPPKRAAAGGGSGGSGGG